MSRGRLRMVIKVVAVCGLLLFLGSIGLGFYLTFHAIKAVGLDRSEDRAGGGILPICSNRNSYSKINVSRLMTVDETQSLTVAVSNTDRTVECETPVSLYTLDFDVSPQDNMRDVLVPPGQTMTTGWILRPRKLGTFQIEVDSIFVAHFLGITVTNVFGLRAWQAQLLSSLGAFFGPLLTAAWWYDRWKERKRKKSDEISLVRPTKFAKPHRRARQRG